MAGVLRGCLGKLLMLALMAGAGVVAWWNYPQLLDRFRGGESVATTAEPSPELADATLDRFEAFQQGSDPEMHLGDAELTSLVRYSLPGMLPEGVEDPSVRVQDGQMYLGARVAVRGLPDVPALKEVMGLLPDTVPVEIRGTLAPFDIDRAALHVDQIQASRVPLPARYIPEILSKLGRAPVEGLPADAVLVPLPRGLGQVYVLRDSLVLVAKR